MCEARAPWVFVVLAACNTGSPAEPGLDAGQDGASPDATSDGAHATKDAGARRDARTPDAGARHDAASREGGRDAGVGAGASVLQFQLNASRDGHYVDGSLTKARAATLALDATFDGTFQGPLWAQPLYVEDGVRGKGTFYVADDSNDVYAIDETTGKAVWQKTPLLEAAAATGACGKNDPAPVGITGTPIIDLASRTIYFSAVTATSDGSVILTQKIHALSIDDGTEQAGWPLDVGTLTSASGVMLNPEPQGQRSACALVNGYLYVVYGGENGDCGVYHGWVVSVPVSDPTTATAFTTGVQGGGIWEVGGMASDGTDMFVVTGNATGGKSQGLAWADAETDALLRFHDGSAFDPSKTTDFFAPSNWQYLDARDSDLVGAGPLVVDVPGATPSELVVTMGKSGVMNLLDRGNLGGVGTGDGTTGEGLYSGMLANGHLRGAAVSYTTPKGTYVVVRTDGVGTDCPPGTSGDLVAARITATAPPTFTTTWCASSGGEGSPIVTTTDATGANPIVWIVGAEGTSQLTGWDGEKGTPVFTGGGVTMSKVNHWTTPIEVHGRILVGSSNRLYAFKAR